VAGLGTFDVMKSYLVRWLILLSAAWLKLGAVAELLSCPVILGFMNIAAVVMIASQLGKLCRVRLYEDSTL